jgi:hypothetical protein
MARSRQLPGGSRSPYGPLLRTALRTALGTPLGRLLRSLLAPRRGPAVVVTGCGPGGPGIAVRLSRAGFQNLRWYGAGADPHRVFRRTAPAPVRGATFDPAGRRWQVALADGTVTGADLLVVVCDRDDPGARHWLPAAIASARPERPGGPVPPAGPPGQPPRSAAFVSTGAPRAAVAAAAAGLLLPDLAGLTLYRAGPKVGAGLAAAGSVPKPRRAPAQAIQAVLPAQRGAPAPMRARPRPAGTTTGRDDAQLAIRVVPEGLVTADGALHRADAVLLGSTFTAAELLGPGAADADSPAGAFPAGESPAGEYCGITVVGVPGLFLLYGPTRAPGLPRLSRHRRGRITVIPAGARPAPSSASASGTAANPISRVTSRSGCSVPAATRPSSPG